MKHFVPCLSFILLAGIGMSQGPSKLDLWLEAWLKQEHPPGEMIDLFVHGKAADVARAVEDHDGLVKMALPRLVSARVPVDRVHGLASHPAVERFECMLDPAFTLNDTMRVRTFIEPVHQGLWPLPEGYDGEGVIMGLIDSGADHNHPDLRHADGTTRILKYWDQTLPVNELTPAEYGYGQVWNSAHIDAGQMTSIDQPIYWGHGTMVTGTAAGNGLANGRHKGAAPASDLIIVSASFSGNFRAKVADGVKFIFDEAEALGRPAVVNASVGTYLGSHDGQDAAALFIDDLLMARNGRVLVCAAGNSNTIAPYHLRTAPGEDTLFTWFRNNNSSGLGFPAVFFEVWADQEDLHDVWFAMGADRVQPGLQYRGRTDFRNVVGNLGQVMVDTLRSFSGHQLGIVQYYAVARGDQYQLQVLMQQPDSAGYNFRFITTGEGRFDVWSSAQFGTSNMVTSIPTVAAYPDIAQYVMPDNNKHIVDSWACSPRVLTVANSYNKLQYVDCAGGTVTFGPQQQGDIAVTSSKGPTRDERLKPDVAATGDVTLSPAPLTWIATLLATEPFKVAEGCMHVRNTGTSMASPVVAGTAALYLQKCPDAPHEEVIAAINGAAFGDAFTGETPNNRWGNGKLHAFNALVSSNESMVLEPLGPLEFCTGGSVQVLAPGDHQAHLWSNGAEENPVTIAESMELSLVAWNGSGCKAYADTITITVHPLPAMPLIDVAGLALTSSPAQGYQWYFNGSPIPGAEAQVFVAGANGDYSVMITDANGCTAMSEPVTILITGMEDLAVQGFALWPSPARNELFVRLPGGSGPVDLQMVDGRGRVVWSRQDVIETVLALPVQGLAEGVYTLRAVSGELLWTGRFVKRS
ncbi:MAG: S8 family peptidase [Flavobacteriales bacterium]|nr:S8 family peptidase [Flavobacteriales bacterium]